MNDNDILLPDRKTIIHEEYICLSEGNVRDYSTFAACRDLCRQIGNYWSDRGVSNVTRPALAPKSGDCKPEYRIQSNLHLERVNGGWRMVAREGAA